MLALLVASAVLLGASGRESLRAIAERLPASIPESLRNARGLRFSPDGQSCAWIERGALCFGDAQGAPVARVALPEMDLDQGSGPTWSSDSKSVAFTYSDWDAKCSVMGIARVREAKPIELLREPNGDLYRPTWSPDGAALAVVAIRREESGKMGDHTRARLRIVDVSDRSVRSVDLSGEGWNKAAAGWRPDGRSIAVALGGPMRHSAMLVSPEDSTVRALAAEYFDGPRRLMWSQDGERVALVTLTHVYVASAPAFELKSLQFGVHGLDAAWIEPHVLCMLVSHRDRDLKDVLDDFAPHGGDDRYRFVPTLVDCKTGETLALEDRSFHGRNTWAWPESEPKVSVLFARSRD